MNKLKIRPKVKTVEERKFWAYFKKLLREEKTWSTPLIQSMRFAASKEEEPND